MYIFMNIYIHSSPLIKIDKLHKENAQVVCCCDYSSSRYCRNVISYD